jgi:hypothetical protein
MHRQEPTAACYVWQESKAVIRSRFLPLPRRCGPDQSISACWFWMLPATFEAATNKLFRAARFELPETGRWEMRVEVEGVHGPAVIGGEIEAAESLPRWREIWPWIGWPALVVVLFGIHQMVARHPGRLGSYSQPSEPIL